MRSDSVSMPCKISHAECGLTQQEGSHGAFLAEVHVVKALIGCGQFGKLAARGMGSSPIKTTAIHYQPTDHCAVPAQKLGGRVVNQIGP